MAFSDAWQRRPFQGCVTWASRRHLFGPLVPGLMLRDDWAHRLPGNVSTLLPQGKRWNSLMQEHYTDVHIHHLFRAIRFEEIEIAHESEPHSLMQECWLRLCRSVCQLTAQLLTSFPRAEGWTEVAFPMDLLCMHTAQGCLLPTLCLPCLDFSSWRQGRLLHS